MSSPEGMPGSIAVDFESLTRAARDLSEAADDVGGAARLANAHPVSAHSFGIVNAPLGSTAQHVATSASELLTLLAASTGALSVAAKDAADEWRDYEQGAADDLAKAAADLEGGRALR